MPEIYETIAVSALTSGVFVGVLKLILDRSLTHKFRKLEQEQIARLSEQYRIKGKVFDDRYTAYNDISRLIATACERSKSMVIFAKKGWFGDFYSYAKSMYQIRNALMSVMTDYRAVLESDMRRISSKAVEVVEALANMYSPDEEQLPDYAEMHQAHIERLIDFSNELQEIDSLIEKFGWSEVKNV